MTWTSPRELIVPGSLAIVAALLRLPNLATRGTWDGDQAHDMLVLRAFVRDGTIPLLGPPTSIGDVHHGALYYYLLAPAAALTGGDSPLAVAVLIALAGILAVVVTWWLAGSIGGPLAGLAAGVAMAVSASAVDESTFIWNPNLIALSSAVALAGAWRAWASRDPRWWLLAGVGAAVTVQCHVLGVTLLPIVGGLLVADIRADRPGRARVRVRAFGLAGILIVAASYLPLVVHELLTGGGEARAALAFLQAGDHASTLGPPARLAVIAARIVSWPLTGLLTDAPLAGLIAVAAVVAIAAWLVVAGTAAERFAARWLALGLAWTAVALTFLSPSLATVVPGLPNDHYHAFADPMVFTLVGLGAAALWRGAIRGDRLARPVSLPRLLAGVGLALLVGWNLARQPPAVHPDGGFPAAEAAGRRILEAAAGETITVRSIPDFKSPEAYAYPLVRAGATVRLDRGRDALARPSGTVLLVCDRLFEPSIGAACGGPAEDRIAPADAFGSPIDRFEAAPGRVVTVYRPR